MVLKVGVETAKQSAVSRTTLEGPGRVMKAAATSFCTKCWRTAFSELIQCCAHHKDSPTPPEDNENKEKRNIQYPCLEPRIPAN